VQNLEEITAFLAKADVTSPPVDPNAATAVKSPEAALADLLLSIEGDKITLDAFQFLFELVCAFYWRSVTTLMLIAYCYTLQLDDYSQEYHKHGKKLKNLFSLIFSLMLACDEQVKVVKALVNLVQAQPSIKQFCKDSEWLTSLLQFLPNFEDPGVLGTSQ